MCPNEHTNLARCRQGEEQCDEDHVWAMNKKFRESYHNNQIINLRPFYTTRILLKCCKILKTTTLQLITPVTAYYAVHSYRQRWFAAKQHSKQFHKKYHNPSWCKAACIDNCNVSNHELMQMYTEKTDTEQGLTSHSTHHYRSRQFLTVNHIENQTYSN